MEVTQHRPTHPLSHPRYQRRSQYLHLHLHPHSHCLSSFPQHMIRGHLSGLYMPRTVCSQPGAEGVLVAARPEGFSCDGREVLRLLTSYDRPGARPSQRMIVWKSTHVWMVKGSALLQKAWKNGNAYLPFALNHICGDPLYETKRDN